MRPRSKLSGKTVKIIKGTYKELNYVVEDWAENVFGQSWMDMKGNPACLKYAMRAGLKDNLPTDDEVLYGKIGILAELVHISEISIDGKT